MRTFLSVLAACLVIFSLTTLAFGIWQYQENRNLTATNAQLARDLDAAENTVSALSEENDRVREKVESLKTLETELRERMASLEASSIPARNIRPEPYRVRAFVGRENVGQAWMVPHNVTWDEEAARYVFEPVLWMEDASRKHFTVHHTNVVEREVFRTEIYEGDNYYPHTLPYYVYGFPNRPGVTNRPPVNPHPPATPQTPSSGYAQQPDVRAQVFAPPMSTVTSRPQVLGRPATSPVNARVFAP